MTAVHPTSLEFVKTALSKYIGYTIPAENGYKDTPLHPDHVYLGHEYPDDLRRYVFTADINDFCTLFANALPPNKPGLTHADLKADDPNDERGWHKWLDKWHEEGLI